MTAEVVVMNKIAVAMAADSAVTIGYPDSNKIYNSANKLFMLSRQHPVGIMFYGSAEFMNVALETIIKIFSETLPESPLDSLEEYADRFIKFLKRENPILFPKAQQRNYFRQTTEQYYYTIRRDHFESTLKAAQEVELEDIIEFHFAEWDRQEDLDDLPEGFKEEISSIAEDVYKSARDRIFEGIGFDEKTENHLKKICIYLAIKDMLPNSSCGVVFAGFGREEIFPSVRSFQIEAIIEGYLKYREIKEQSGQVDFDNPAAIISFAQSEMVGTFMEGINPDYKAMIAQYWTDMLNGISEIIPDSFIDILHETSEVSVEKDSKLAKELRQSFSLELSKIVEILLQKFEDEKRLYEIRNHINPIISNVMNLPVDELAEMAEALVNLTSVRRRVSTDAETVGGPIDVAVISKRDGFIWIKRKKYFDPKDNPHFLKRYEEN